MMHSERATPPPVFSAAAFSAAAEVEDAQYPDDGGLALMLRMAREDAAALDDFSHTFGDALFGIALQMLGSREDAEEVLQDMLVKVWYKAQAYDPARGRPYTWAVTILRGLCLDRLRARGRRPVLLRLEPQWDAPSLQLSDPGVVADLREAWDGLTGEEQSLLSCLVFSPATAEQIATAQGEPLGTIKSRLRRTMLKFFRRSTRDHDDEPNVNTDPQL